jgi:hypothetical protein
MFLEKPDHAIDDEDDRYGRRVEQFTEDEGQHARSEEQPDHGARELPREQDQATRRGLAANLVRTELGQPPLCLIGRKAGGYAGIGWRGVSAGR